MGYRKPDIPMPMPDDFLPVFSVHNGEDATFSIPCFYLEIEPPEEWHDYHLHDHIGWPNPTHPDHICQRLEDFGHWHDCYGQPMFHHANPCLNHVFEYVDMDKATPIHWRSEFETLDNPVTMFDRIAYVTFDQADEEDNIDSGKYVSYCGEYRIVHAAGIRNAPDDHIIDVLFSVDGPAPMPNAPVRLHFTLFTALNEISSPSTYTIDGSRQVVLRGWLEILPAASYDHLHTSQYQ